MDIRILNLFKKNWEKFPEVPFLEMIGSCFLAAGDISHISDDELLKNLIVLLEMEQEERISKPKRKRLELVTKKRVND